MKGHLRLATLGIVLGGTSQDILGYSEAVHYIFVYLGQLGKSVAVLDIMTINQVLMHPNKVQLINDCGLIYLLEHFCFLQMKGPQHFP